VKEGGPAGMSEGVNSGNVFWSKSCIFGRFMYENVLSGTKIIIHRVKSQSLRSRCDRHFVGITRCRPNAFS